MATPIEIEIRGHGFQLFPERCLYWPAERMLFAADAHLGKEATFVRNGIPVPGGSTRGTLDTLTRLLRQTGAKRFSILGDLFHARSSLSRSVRRTVENFLQSCSDIEMLLVMGNHDQHVGRLPSAWPIEAVAEGHRIGSVVLGHHPAEPSGNNDVYLCGHLHPAVRVGNGHDSLGRLPCFWHRDGCIVLPAVGEFTGTHLIRPIAGDEAWVICDDQLFRYPVPATSR